MPAAFVKAFNIGNKNDAADARAVWLAVQQPCKAVAVKTEAQQAVLALHRIRQRLVKFRTMQMNCLRGLLAEYGEVMARSRVSLDKAMPGILAKLTERLPMILIESLREQWNGLTKLDEQIAGIEDRLRDWMKKDKAAKAIAEIPGVGLLTAAAAVAAMGNARHSSPAGNSPLGSVWYQSRPARAAVTLLGISRRGDTYLRTLLIHGARAVVHLSKDPGDWIRQMSQRRPKNVVVIALANKMARTIWAVLAHDRPYQRDHTSVKPT